MTKEIILTDRMMEEYYKWHYPGEEIGEYFRRIYPKFFEEDNETTK